MSPIIGSFSGSRAFGRGGGGGVGGPGEAIYTSPGTYTWVAPEGVESVCVVCIGAGGAGGYQWSSGGGGGGGLGWKNDISVNPGSSYTVVVGAGGATDAGGVTNAYNSGAEGNNSYFINLSTVSGYGSGRGGSGSISASPAYGGGYIGDGGGRGGDGARDGSWNYGGAGAGGYSGRGADTYGNGSSTGISAPSGSGGGGAGGWYSSTYGVPAGGGTGLFGRGADGISAGTSSGYPNGGYGGSGGTRGVSGENARAAESGQNQNTIFGGGWGGGGGGSGTSWGGGSGASGAVRIMWGEERSFPTNASYVTPTTPLTPDTEKYYLQVEAEFLAAAGPPQLWYKSRDLSGYGEGNDITLWKNSGSYGRACDLLSGISSIWNTPPLKYTDDGKVSAYFDTSGNGRFLRFRNQRNIMIFGSSQYQSSTIFAVYRESSQNGNFAWLSRYGGDGTNGSIGMWPSGDTNTFAQIHENDGFPVTISSMDDDTDWIQRGFCWGDPDGSGYYSQTSGNANIYHWTGNGSSRTNTSWTAYGARLQVNGIGATRTTANNGYMSELIWYDRPLSNVETTAVRKYLNTRFSV